MKVSETDALAYGHFYRILVFRGLKSVIGYYKKVGLGSSRVGFESGPPDLGGYGTCVRPSPIAYSIFYSKIE